MRNWKHDRQEAHLFVRGVGRDLREAIWTAAEREHVSVGEWITRTLRRALGLTGDAASGPAEKSW